MNTIIPPHTCAAHLEKLGIKNIPQVNPSSINFTRFMRYIGNERYPEEILDEIYQKILENPENGKEYLYKLVFDILIFSGVARDLDILVSLYRTLGDIDDETKEDIDSLLFGTSTGVLQVPKEQKRARWKESRKYLFKIGFDALRPTGDK